VSGRAERCERCRFWVGYPGEGPIFAGECRRNPPQLLQNDRLLSIDASGDIPVGKAWWPWTMRDDWCGEFRPHPDKELRS
jgi:hypothetical protein